MKILERRGVLRSIRTNHPEASDERTYPRPSGAEVTLTMEGSDREITVPVSPAEADRLHRVVIAYPHVKISMVFEVDEKTLRERVDRMEQEVKILKDLVSG